MQKQSFSSSVHDRGLRLRCQPTQIDLLPLVEFGKKNDTGKSPQTSCEPRIVKRSQRTRRPSELLPSSSLALVLKFLCVGAGSVAAPRANHDVSVHRAVAHLRGVRAGDGTRRIGTYNLLIVVSFSAKCALYPTVGACLNSSPLSHPVVPPTT